MEKVSSAHVFLDPLDLREPAPVERAGCEGTTTRHPRAEVDESILIAAQRGEREALERFILHYQDRVFAFISRATGAGSHVEDLAQEVFLRVFRALPQFVRREAKVSTWIFQIAVRLIQDRRKRYRPQLVAVNDQLAENHASPETNVENRQQLSRLERFAAELPEEQRLALVLMEFHGLPHDEIARVMGCEVATVKTRVHRARTFLRKRMFGDLKEAST